MFFLNFILSILTIFLQAFILFLIFVLIFKKNSWSKKVLDFIKKNYLILGFLVSFGATGGSLIYSEVFHFQPCFLCWYQRILMYPQFLIFSLALVRRDNKIYPYIMFLSLIGIFVSGYHYFLQINPSNSGFCGNSLVDCSLALFTYIGYINIPMMALTSFLFLFLISLVTLIYEQERKQHKDKYC